ncbi:MAG TPA: carboxypeptidase-like regulatory domain-containing protein, partial [Saprospiraceae bacterium]|nr:carboxypeptidase-like regulatory domain-containing protein [Saprospiraceae bacterium]
MIRHYLTAGLLLLLALPLSAQKGTVSGRVTDAEDSRPIANVSVVLAQTGLFAATDAEGKFRIENAPAGSLQLVVSASGFLPSEQNFELKPGEDKSVDIALRRDPTNQSGEIPTVTLDEAEAETEGAGEVANLLHASRDVFQSISNFGWGFFRFRERGYESEHFPLFLNGVSINDPETGIAFFGEFGGLNDVLRQRETVIGLDAADFAFSEVGGATRIDTRASVQRKQIRATYALSNRAYNQRVMLTASTGLMPGGWAVSVSGSRRWAEEGWYDGTFFDGYSYFLSVDKKFGDKHSLNLTFLGAPSTRGRNGDTFQEMYDLAGTTRYNPNWGYWNGEKRNASVNHSHQPIALLRYDWTPGVRTGM